MHLTCQSHSKPGLIPDAASSHTKHTQVITPNLEDAFSAEA